MKTLITAISIFIGYVANASPTHLFYCAITNTEPMSQVLFEIEDRDLVTGIGHITISKLSVNDSTNSGWQKQEQAQIKMNIKWGSNNGTSIITGISSDMGRSGKIEAKMTGPIDSYDNSSGYIQSTLLSLNAPNGIASEYCAYFLSLGPKPGMTGSN